MSRWLKWQSGRQSTGYEKMLIFQIGRCDCYLLRFQQNSFVGPHVDKTENGRHFRLNITLKRARLGGIFYCQKNPTKLNLSRNSNRVVLFRPDILEHSLSKVFEGELRMLSVGWVRR